MDFEVLHLSKAQFAIPTIAKWLFEEWGYIHENDSIERRIGILNRQMNLDSIPFTYVALKDNRPMGSASIVQTDIPDRDDLTPCVASVLVHKNFRKMGVGSALMKAIVNHAWEIGYDILYLFTWDQEKLYASLRWETIEHSTFRNEPIVIMKLKKEQRNYVD